MNSTRLLVSELLALGPIALLSGGGGDPYVQVSPGTARNADGHTSASKADGSYMFIAGSDDETLGLWGLRESVSSDVEEGMDKLGYDFGQAILFAHSSLELKLENFPEEDIFALTALLACILDRGGALLLYEAEDEIPFQFARSCADDSVGNASQALSGAELVDFLRDLGRVKAALSA
ncbi:hypothetical protein [Stenotrophomonas maltophilia]|uniref:hypothetical protein n=1 Tax=Stenotrophomonas maltophilia TaxID=40324 RepID=UPI002E792235|nr:hypothetical protein [Stenotrophomonas maltophilia]